MRGVDVVTALSEGMVGRADSEHLEYATHHRRVLYSFNIGDYYQLHTRYLQQGRAHAGIILAQQQRYNLGEQLRRLLRIVVIRSAEDMRNNIEFLSAWG